MEKIETKIALIQKDVEYIKKAIDKQDSRYSFKWVEKGAKWIITIVCGTALVALLTLIIK